MNRLARAALALALVGCAGGDGVGETGSGGSAGATGATTGGPVTDGAGGHGCFASETLCDGACVDTDTHPQHCGMCNNPCASGPSEMGECVAGECTAGCAAGFYEDGGVCKNFFGAHEAYPVECAMCQVANPFSNDCACPAWATELPLHVQSDCPGVPMRSKTELKLCVTGGVAPDSDFGGAYQVDDADGLCGAMPGQCRAGNPLAGGACACPAGFDTVIGLRSILRLPCDNTEYGSVVFFCGNMNAATTTFAGAYQWDDFAPNCRVANPWTGDCTCPMGTTDRAYRVMVDGALGLYGSTMHLCTVP